MRKLLAIFMILSLTVVVVSSQTRTKEVRSEGKAVVSKTTIKAAEQLFINDAVVPVVQLNPVEYGNPVAEAVTGYKTPAVATARGPTVLKMYRPRSRDKPFIT